MSSMPQKILTCIIKKHYILRHYLTLQDSNYMKLHVFFLLSILTQSLKNDIHYM